jgi:hypothetical protein
MVLLFLSSLALSFVQDVIEYFKTDHRAIKDILKIIGIYK